MSSYVLSVGRHTIFATQLRAQVLYQKEAHSRIERVATMIGVASYTKCFSRLSCLKYPI